MPATVLATSEAALGGRHACSRCGRAGPGDGWTDQISADARGVWRELICPSCIHADEIKLLLDHLAGDDETGA